LFTGCIPRRETQILQKEPNNITVVGVGDVKATPDVAQIICNIRIKDKDLLTAKGKNQEISAKARAAFKKLNIEESDIQSEYLHMYTENMSGQTSLPAGYVAQTAIRVTVHDLSRIEDILTSGLEAGATNVQGVYFQISDLEFYKEQARSMALQEAKAKAAMMADELGQKAGEPLSIYESQMYPANSSLFNAILVTTTYDPSYLNLSNNDSAIMFGQVSVRATLTVKFSLRE
jgi:uncharacterized protein YggE